MFLLLLFPGTDGYKNTLIKCLKIYKMKDSVRVVDIGEIVKITKHRHHWTRRDNDVYACVPHRQ